MRRILAILMTVLMLATCVIAAAENKSPMTGGWTPAREPAVTQKQKELFDKAMDGLLGVNYQPVAYLGSQVVAGVNHCYLAQATVVAPDAEPYWVLVYIYQRFDGTVQILNIADFDIGALCTYGAAE